MCTIRTGIEHGASRDCESGTGTLNIAYSYFERANTLEFGLKFYSKDPYTYPRNARRQAWKQIVLFFAFGIRAVGIQTPYLLHPGRIFYHHVYNEIVYQKYFTIDMVLNDTEMIVFNYITLYYITNKTKRCRESF